MKYDREDFKVSFYGEPTFYVNKETGKITCTIFAYVNTPHPTERGNNVFVPGFVVKETATAKCADGDTFDINRGKRIALAKAENKVYHTATKKIEKAVENYRFIVTAFDMFDVKSYSCQAHNIDYIDTLSMPAHVNYRETVDEPRRGVEIK